jgi:RHS repeat-associated protein
VANHLWSGNSGCPVATFTGELYEAPGPDLVLGGPMPLRFRRYYAAWIKRDGFISGRLGDNWLHNFEMLLIPATNNLVEVVTQFGRVIQFTNNAGGGYALVGRMDVPYQLVGTGTNYVLGDPFSQRLYTFDTGGKLTQIADGRGNAHTLAYSGGLLAGVSDGLGHSLSFLYNSSGQLTNVRDGVRSVSFTQTGTVLTQSTDALGNPTTYSYDSSQAVSALMTSRTQPEGNVPFFQVFDSSGRVASQIEAGVMPGTNTFTYTTSNSTSIADPFTFSWRDNYSALGDLTNTTDPTGHFLSMAYNTNGQRISVTDRLGYTTLLGYHPPSGKMSAFTNSDGNFVTFTYSSHKAAGMTFYDLASINYPDGTSEKASYDAQGNLLSQTDRAGQVTTYSYNSRGQVLAATNPVGGVITLTYNADGTMATRTDSDIGTTSYFYDQFRRLTNTVNSDATSSQTAYDAADRIISATDEMGRKFTFTFDRNGNRRQLTDPGGNSSFFGYDPRNRLLAVTNRLGEVTTFSYDQRGLMTTNVSPTGDVTSFAYDSRRRPAVATDPVGNAWQTSYDNEDLLAAATNPSSQTSTLTRNSMGQITNTADPLLETVNLARDPMQRITQALDPLSRSNNFSYDPRGILSGAARQGLGAALYQYNPLGLISGITDLNSNLWTFAYTPMGRPQSVTDPLGRTRSFLYDIRGRLQIISYPDGTTCSNAYDPTGNPVAVEYSAGPNVQYTYDALNRMTSTSDLGFSYDAESRLTNTASSGVNFGASYDASGRLIGATYFNGAFSVVYAYDRRGLLTNVSDTLTGAKVSFFYDISDRLISVTRANGVNGAYGYDAAGRLTSLQEGTFINLQFGLDPAGEITNQTLAAPLDPSTLLAPSFQDFAYDPADQIAGGGYAYDHRGRLTASPGHKYTWDGASRLAGIDAVTMTYNGLNQLLTRTQNGATVRYFYNRAIGFAPIMAERNESTLQIQRYYVWAPGGRLLYLIDPTHGNAVSYFHFDQVGSTLALTTAAGAVSDSYAYTPNGALLGHAGSSTQPFAFIGEFGVRTEPAAGLCDMRARYYDPLSARFLTPDSLWPRLSRPDALDPYQYALRNPFRYIDPAGKCEFGGGNALAGGALVLDTFAGGLIFAGNNAQTAANLANAEAATIAAKGANELFDMYEGYCNGTIAEEAGNGSLAFETYTEEAALDLVNGTYGGTPGNPFAPGAGKNAIFSPQAEIQAKKWWYSNLGEEVETLETEGAQLSQRASTLRAVGTGLAVVGITVQTGVAVYQDIHNGAGVVVTVTDAASTISANAAIMAAPPWPPWISSPAAPSPVAFITPS